MLIKMKVQWIYITIWKYINKESACMKTPTSRLASIAYTNRKMSMTGIKSFAVQSNFLLYAP